MPGSTGVTLEWHRCSRQDHGHVSHPLRAYGLVSLCHYDTNTIKYKKKTFNEDIFNIYLKSGFCVFIFYQIYIYLNACV